MLIHSLWKRSETLHISKAVDSTLKKGVFINNCVGRNSVLHPIHFIFVFNYDPSQKLKVNGILLT